MLGVNARWLVIAADAGIFIFGIAIALLGALLPVVHAKLHIDMARAGILFFTMNSTTLLTMLGLGPLLDHFGKKPALVLGPLLVGGALALVGRAQHFEILVFAVAVLGVGGGLLNAGCNTLVADLHAESGRKNAALNLLGVFFGFGALFLPLTLGALLARLGLERILDIAAAFCVLPFGLSLLLRFPAPRNSQRPPFALVWKYLRNPLVLAFGALLLFEAGNEIAIAGFTTSLLYQELGSNVRNSSFMLGLYWATVMLTRLALGRLLLRIRGSRLIAGSALTAACGLALLLQAQGEFAAAGALVLVGVGVAGIFPTTLGLAGTRFSPYSGTVFGILFAMSGTGGMIMPWMVGQTASRYTLKTAMLICIAAFFAIVFLQSLITRLSRRVAAATLLLALCVGSARAEEFFPMAVWYGGGKARAPMLEPNPRAKKEIWRKDVRQIKALGFNSIRCWIDWASGEPDQGRYDFSTLDVLLDVAREEGLKVIVQTYMDAAPDWVGRKYPDSLYVDASGKQMVSESSPGFCVDHPGVRRAQEAFFTALASRAARSTAFYGWDLWSEPHVINWATANYLYRAEFCFCPHSVVRFRAWLQKKYPTLDALNQAWYRRFRSWDEVQPSRLSTILSYSDYIDWRGFVSQKLGEDLRMRYTAVKRGAPDRVATSHAAIPSLFTSPLAGDGSPDDWTMVRQVDYYGTSFYPKHSSPVGRDVAWRAALLDFEKSSAFGPGGKGGFWVGELQGGFGTVALNVGATVTPEDLRIWTWSAIARGARAINYYAWYPMSTGYESGGYGLIQLDGTVTERSRVAGGIARAVQANAKLLLEATPEPAAVAIVFNPLAYMVGGRQRVVTPGAQSEVASIERDSWMGAYRAMFASNVPVEYVHVNELDAAHLKRYKLLLFPYPLMIPERSAAALREYVRGGGHLVSEARLGWNNERGHASEIIPGMGLHEVTGCRESAVQTVAGLKTELTWSGDVILRKGGKLPGRLYEETLEPLSNGRVVAHFADGRGAAVLAKFGAGQSLMLGSYVAVTGEAAEGFFTGLLDWAGVGRPVTASGGMEARLMRSGADRLLFVFNHGAKAAATEIRIPHSGATDLLTGEAVAALRREIPAGDVWILRLKP